MTINLVTVTVAATGSPADASQPEGQFVFVPNGTLWPAVPGSLPVVPLIQRGTLTAGTATVQLVATDNYAAGVLNWDVIINIRGLPTINVAALQVLYASGASQSVWNILQSNGWIPVFQP